MQTIILGELEITIGDGGDLTEADLYALQRQHPDRLPLPPELVKRIVAVMRTFPGARIVEGDDD
jgi:hypothetical protein